MATQRTIQANMLGGISQQDAKVRQPTAFEDVNNFIPDPVTGNRRRGPIQWVNDANQAINSGDRAYHSYKRDENEQYHFMFIDDEAGNGTVQAYDAKTGDTIPVIVAGSHPAVTIDADYVTRGYSSNDIKDYLALGTRSAQDRIRALTIQDTTFVWNRDVTPAMDSSVLIPYVAPFAYIFVAAGNYEITYEVEVERSTGRQKVSVRTWDGRTAIAGSATAATWVPGTSTELNSVETDDIAAVLALELRNLGAPFNVGGDVSASGAVISIAIQPTGLTNVYAVDGVADSNLRAFYKDTPRVEGWLPTVAIDYTAMRVSGAAEIDADDYWVEFRNNALYDYVHPLAAINNGPSTGWRFGKGTWRETGEPGTVKGIDPRTMPIKIERQFDDAAGSATGTPFKIFFKVDYIRWEDKAAGLASDPVPSFIGQPIQDVFFYKERLGFVSGNNVNLSETGQYFNFFRITNLNLRDTAPIDVSVPHDMPVKFTFALAGSEDTTLFTHLGQFLLRGQDILSPRTIEVLPASSFPSTPDVKPIAAGRRLFTVFDRDGYVGIRELYKAPEASRYQELDITINVPTLMKGKVRKMWAADNEDVLFVQLEDDQETVYMYKWLFSGDEKVISSWSKIQLSSGLLTGLFDGSTFRFAGIRPEFFQAWLAFGQMPLIPSSSDVYLDWWCDENTALSKVFSGGNTTITLPIPGTGVRVASLGYRFVYYDAGTPGLDPRQLVLPTTAWTSGLNLVVVVPGDFTTRAFKVGLTYDSSLTYTPPYVFETAGNGGVTHKRNVQKVLRGFVAYSNAEQFKVSVTNGSRATKVYPMNDSVPTADNAEWLFGAKQGEMRFSVRGSPDASTIVLSTDDPWDLQLQGTQWEVNYRSRSPRFQG